MIRIRLATVKNFNFKWFLLKSLAVPVVVCVCVCVHTFKHTQLCLILCDPMDCTSPVSSVHGFSRREYWSGLPFPSAGDLPHPGIKPTSLESPAGGFFTTCTT